MVSEPVTGAEPERVSFAEQLVERHGRPMRDALDQARERSEAEEAAFAAGVAAGRTQAAEELWTRAEKLRAGYPGNDVGIEYVNGFEDAVGALERIAEGTDHDT